MRRKDREITDRADIQSIIRKARVCRLAVSEDDRPYIVPLCFGFKDNALYFHSAREGRKLQVLKRNNHVCFEFDVDHEMVPADEACKWSLRYRSVIGFGRASIIDDPGAKRRALDVIMQHYSDRSYTYTDRALDNTIIIKVDIDRLTGKQSGY